MQKVLASGDSNVHDRCGAAVDKILVTCVEAKTLDNITAVIIGFNGFEKMTNIKGYQLNPKITEVKFDWDVLEVEAQSDEQFRGQKLQKPLEAVIEEEASEVDSSRS